MARQKNVKTRIKFYFVSFARDQLINCAQDYFHNTSIFHLTTIEGNNNIEVVLEVVIPFGSKFFI